VGKSDKIRVFTRRERCALNVVHRVTGRLIELLKLGQDFGAELDVMMADQGNAPTKIFVDSTQGHQVPLLKVCVVT
jgi:hypothetical protein